MLHSSLWGSREEVLSKASQKFCGWAPQPSGIWAGAEGLGLCILHLWIIGRRLPGMGLWPWVRRLSSEQGIWRGQRGCTQCFQKLENKVLYSWRTHKHTLSVWPSQVAVRMGAGDKTESAWTGLKILLSLPPLINSGPHPASLDAYEAVWKQMLEEPALQNRGKESSRCLSLPQKNITW